MEAKTCTAPSPAGTPCGARICWVEFSRECKRCKGKRTIAPPSGNPTAIGCPQCSAAGREHVRLPVNATRVRTYQVVDDRGDETPLVTDQGLAYVSHFLTCRGLEAVRRRQGKKR